MHPDALPVLGNGDAARATEAPSPTSSAEQHMTPSLPTLKDLNFKVDPSLHRAFKTASAMSGLSMRELLEASLLAWIDAHGAETLKAFLFKRDEDGRPRH